MYMVIPSQVVIYYTHKGIHSTSVRSFIMLSPPPRERDRDVLTNCGSMYIGARCFRGKKKKIFFRLFFFYFLSAMTFNFNYNESLSVKMYMYTLSKR